jgi:hypothetical protein
MHSNIPNIIQREDSINNKDKILNDNNINYTKSISSNNFFTNEKIINSRDRVDININNKTNDNKLNNNINNNIYVNNFFFFI